MNALIITGTDTGVGKTYVACGMAAALHRRGMDVGVFKPFCTGTRADVLALQRAAHSSAALEVINPVFLPLPLAPYRAAALAGVTIDIADVLRTFDLLRHQHDVVLVEGIGGLMVPLCRGAERIYSFRDFCADCGAAVLIVARRTLGTLNHTWLTVNACREAGLPVLGVIFNDTEPQAECEPASSNPALLAECAAVPLLGCVPYAAAASAFDACVAPLLSLFSKPVTAYV
ncbi:MAG: dethiobiotin synthase [bacterium]|nr:dethiobiotin synthase [bacterium]